ncbi:hypothetical protein [Actinoplanes sp. NPDC051851]|uniref:hypothetical protein n=1 Tax=Actinoplanes sp. NPDC051851 TaxID=3154753 RepID=UPI00342E69E2
MSHPDRDGEWRPHRPATEENHPTGPASASPVPEAFQHPPFQHPPFQHPPFQHPPFPQAPLQQAPSPQASSPPTADDQPQPRQALSPGQPASQVPPAHRQPAEQQQVEQRQFAAGPTAPEPAAPPFTTPPLTTPLTTPLTSPPLTEAQRWESAKAAQVREDERPPGDGPGDDRPSAPDDDPGTPGGTRTGPSGRAGRLHIGWHAISLPTLERLAVAPAAGAGLLLGRDRRQMPVSLRLFAPEPVRLALVGGVWAAQLLIFRALALGARVAVVTTEPGAWAGLGERATGQYNRLTVHSSDQGPPLNGTAQMPTLVVYDTGASGPVASLPPAPWRSRLTVLRQLDDSGVAALQDVSFTLLQRLGDDEAALATSALRLGPHSAQFLRFMADDMLALIGDGTDRYLFLAQTDLEQQYLGLPHR